MKVSKTNLIDCLLIEPRVFKDFRGSFFESFSKLRYQQDALINHEFVQDNFSSSRKGVLRGLHYQLPPFEQSKLVSVIKGSIIDVVVDIRKNSLTFLKNIQIELSEENKKQLFIPKGFAHGFCTIESDTEVQYKVSAPYSLESEAGLAWDDPNLGIDWPLGANKPILSDKDKYYPNFQELPNYFNY